MGGVGFVAGEAVAEVVAGDAEEAGGGGDVAMALLEGMADEMADGFLQAEAFGGETEIGFEPRDLFERPGGIDGSLEIVEMERSAFFEDDGALEFVGEFADVAWPEVGEEARAAGGGKFLGGEAMAAAELIEEHFSEADDVFTAVTEGRDGDAVEIEPVHEVFAEEAGGDGFFEVGVGGGDDPDINGNFPGAAETADAVFFDGLEDFGLESGREAGKLVQKEGATTGGFKEANAHGAGVGEGAAFVAEEFGFSEAFREGRAIDLDDGLGATGSALMKPAGDGGFAGAGFAEDQDRWKGGFDADIGGDDFIGNGLNGGHGAAEVKGAGGLLTGVGAALFFSAGGLAVAAGAGDDEGEFLDIEGFGEIIRSAGAHGVHGAGDAALGGHDDDAGFGGEIFIAEQGGAQTIGEIYIDEGEVEALFGGEAAGGGEGTDVHDIGAKALKGGGDLFAKEDFVLED